MASDYHILKPETGDTADFEIVCTISSGTMIVIGRRLYTTPQCTGSPGSYTLVCTDEIGTSRDNCRLWVNLGASTSGWTYTISCDGKSGNDITVGPAADDDELLSFSITATASGEAPISWDPKICLRNSQMITSDTPTVG